MADIRAKLQLDTRDAEKNVNKLGSAFKALVAGASVKAFVDLGDEFTQITNRLKSVSGSTAEASQAFELVKRVAANTRSGLEPVAGLFADLTIATEEMGLSQKEVAAVAGTFSKALKVSGADANASSGAIRQFGQALASGVLRGDEFNSIMEANPAFMRKVAGTLEVTTGQLRSMAEQGLLTSDVLVAATQEIGDSIDKDFAKTVSTVGEAFVALKNSFLEIIGRIESNTGIFTSLADTITHVADNLDVYIKLAALAFGVGAIKGVMNFVKAIQALQIVTKAQAVAQAALLALSGPAGWGILAGAAAATTLAVVGINKALGETEDAAQDAIDSMGDGEDAARKVTTELEKQVDANKDGILQVKEIVQLNILLQAEKKKQKALDDEKTRILKNQQETFNAITGELALTTAEFEKQLQLSLDLVGATDNQKTRMQAIFDLEKERTDELTELNELTRLSTEQRAQKEAEINQIYDERINKLNTTQDILNAIADAGTKFDITEATRNNIDSLLFEIGKMDALLDANSTKEKDRLQKEYDLFSEIQSKRRELQTKIDKDIAEQKAKLGRELTAEEIKLIMEKYAVEKEGLEEARALFEQYGSNVLDIYDKLIEKSMSFGQGIKDSFAKIRDFVDDQAAYSGRIIDTMAQGFEDAILNFVETGKLSFKDLFKSLLAEIIKMQANRMFLALFSPEGGLFGNLFSGFFANGGFIPAGKIGIAGERGPELIRGPASVTSTADTAALLSGGSTQVTYNIQAIDSRSFEERLAERPEFIYAVTEAGRRRSPGGRL